MADLLVAGYDVVELLGFGSGGEVWLAREQATGEPVALKRLHAGADLAARDRLRREAAVLAGIDHPHVLKLRSVVGAGESLVLVLDLATGGSLARLLATRGRLSPGEVVTIAVPLAQALAAVHSQGVVHGDVTPGNVLFTADGRPVLSDLGVSRFLGVPHADVSGTAGFLDPAVVAGGEPDEAGDVYGLAATCLAALAGHPPHDDVHALPADGTEALTNVLRSALAPDPADRPGAAELAAAVFDAVVARPVQMGLGAEDVEPGTTAGAHELTHRVVRVAGGPAGAVRPAPGHRSRRGSHRAAEPASGGRRNLSALPWRAVLVSVLSAVCLAMVVLSGHIWTGAGRDGSPEQAAGSRPSPVASPGSAPVPVASLPTRPGQVQSAPRWAETLAALDASRSDAFAAADPAGLDVVYAPGAPALDRDRAALQRLASTGLRARGLRMRTVDVSVIARSPRRVRLHVRDAMPAYQLVDAGGRVVESRSGRPLMAWSVTLTRAGQRWLVYDVERA